MEYTKLDCQAFVDVLASKEPVPGGGGASALVAAIGMALGNMVGSLTVGKKKYADVEAEIIALKAQADDLQQELLALVQADAACFAPLAKAYGLPKETEEERAHKAKVMEEALRTACSVPLRIMEACCRAIDVTEAFAAKGTKIAISDAGVAAIVLRSALLGASLNVTINTGSMADREYAKDLEEQAERMLQVYGDKAQAIFDQVRAQLQ